MAKMTNEEIEVLLARVPEGYTPGPWYPVFNGHFWDISLDDAPMSHSVADTCASNSLYGEHVGPDGQPGNHGEANAALIALAPDLVAALRQTLARNAELEAAGNALSAVVDLVAAFRQTLARNAELEAAGNALSTVVEMCDVSDGTCCCGDDMTRHSDPMFCGHTPTDHGACQAGLALEARRAALAEAREREAGGE